MQRSLIMVLIVAGLCSCIAQDRPPRTLDLCTAATNLSIYSGRQVRIAAYVAVGQESVALFDPKCQHGEPMMWVEFKPKVGGQMEALRRILEVERSARVTLEGTMRGGEPVKIDPKLPDWIRNRFKGASQTYGHLGSFDMMIEVSNVVDVETAEHGIQPKAAVEERR